MNANGTFEPLWGAVLATRPGDVAASAGAFGPVSNLGGRALAPFLGLPRGPVLVPAGGARTLLVHAMPEALFHPIPERIPAK